MSGVEKIDKIKGDVISNLDESKLKKYLFYLTGKYYESYLKNDEQAFNESVETLMNVIDEYREIYINLMGYVYYCLYLNSVLIISKKFPNDNFSLKNIAKYDLMEFDAEEEELHHDIKNIFNKERVRERYNEKRISEFIE